jgi:hypothetical protein
MVVNIWRGFVVRAGSYVIASRQGQVIICDCGADAEEFVPALSDSVRHRDDGSGFHRPFFWWPPWARGRNSYGPAIGAPDWMIILPWLAAAAALAWPELRAWRRRRRGETRCVKCGYDRRGLPGAGAACPECGTVPARGGRG